MSGVRKVRKKKLGSYPFLNVIFSITLSLLVIGLFGIVMIYSNTLTRLIQENIEIQVFLNKNITESERIKISKTLSSKDYVLLKEGQPQIDLITKEQAARQFIQETGENFVEFIGENPLRDALVIKISPRFHQPEQMQAIRSEIEAERGVFEVVYVENLVESVANNLTKISLILSGVAVALILVVVILINNTIKLALFSQRFLIRSMQLVGATTGFIKTPFLTRSANYGLLSGILASAILYGLLTYANSRIPDLSLLQNNKHMLMLMAGLILTGILVGFVSTFRAINRYLKMSLDELY